MAISKIRDTFSTVLGLTKITPKKINEIIDAVNANISSYKVYTATLTQTGTDAPIATVLENSLGGDIVWTRFGAGTYLGTLTGAFPNVNKVYRNFADFTDQSYQLVVNDSDTLLLITKNAAGASVDDLMVQTPMSIEIKVYN